MPPAVRSSASSGSTTTRSSNGRIRVSLLILGSSLMESLFPRTNTEIRFRISHPHVTHSHAAHTAHASHAHATHAPAHVFLMVVMVVFLALLRDGGDERFRGEQQAGDAGA